jgi:hypothetical protein
VIQDKEGAMTAFRILTIAMFGVLALYTGEVIAAHGMTLFEVYFGDMARMAWAGQFNLDFLFMLTFSALWTAWRNGFSPLGLVLAVVAFFGGSGFLAVYLFILSLQAKGDMREILLGRSRLGA